jgi:hypothetical protein
VAAHKLDIFQTLDAIDRRNLEYLNRLEPEQRAGFAPPVVLRWASAASDGPEADLMLMLVNERANMNFHDIWEHPDLQFKLIASSGVGRKLRHQWIPMAQRKKSASALHEFLSKYWPQANEAELDLLVRQFTFETYTDFVNGCGLDPKETTAVLDLYAKLHGVKNASKKKKSKS